jgi:acyl-CoA dehydrogenase
VLERVVAEQLVLVSTGAADWLDSSGTTTRVDGGYRVHARKSPASAATVGDIVVTSVRWEDAPDGPSVIHAALPFGADGVSVEPTWDATGMRATGSDTIVFDDVFIPDAAVSLVRPAGMWHPVWATVLGAAMPLIMSTYVGVAESATERAIELAGHRTVGPEVTTPVGRMVNSLTTARDVVRAMIDSSEDLHFDNDMDHASLTLARKAVAAEAVIDTVRTAFEVGGGSAYARSSGLGRLLRDSFGAVYHPLPSARQERFTGLVALGRDPVAG